MQKTQRCVVEGCKGWKNFELFRVRDTDRNRIGYRIILRQLEHFFVVLQSHSHFIDAFFLHINRAGVIRWYQFRALVFIFTDGVERAITVSLNDLVKRIGANRTHERSRYKIQVVNFCNGQFVLRGCPRKRDIPQKRTENAKN